MGRFLKMSSGVFQMVLVYWFMYDYSRGTHMFDEPLLDLLVAGILFIFGFMDILFALDLIRKPGEKNDLRNSGV